MGTVRRAVSASHQLPMCRATISRTPAVARRARRHCRGSSTGGNCSVCSLGVVGEKKAKRYPELMTEATGVEPAEVDPTEVTEVESLAPKPARGSSRLRAVLGALGTGVMSALLVALIGVGVAAIVVPAVRWRSPFALHQWSPPFLQEHGGREADSR